MARTMSKYLKKAKANNDLSLMFIFFDGEKAFLEWDDNDSIYGSRHLAAKFEKENFLQKINILVLLDLLGTPNPTFFSTNPESSLWYMRLVKAEKNLGKMNFLKNYAHPSFESKNSTRYFSARAIHSETEDDHLPFMRRNVKILHLICKPFPAVWHDISDDRNAIDFDTVENLMKILKVFIAEYLHVHVNK